MGGEILVVDDELSMTWSLHRCWEGRALKSYMLEAEARLKH